MVEYSLVWYNFLKKYSYFFLNLVMAFLVTFSNKDYKMDV